jgi:ABC-type branched-subunit amino acid transport system permease subunit
MNRSDFTSPAAIKRLIACLAGSFVLALMWGPQEGVQEDYGYAFRQAIFSPRILVFLGIGVLVFLAITFWPLVRPNLVRPGAPSFLAGTITVVAAYTLLRWYDPLGKFGAVASAVAATSNISPIASAFFGWLHWTELIVTFLVGGVAIARRDRRLAWIAAALCVVSGVIAVVAHQEVVSKGGGVDHSLGPFVAAFGYLVMAVACAAAALTHQQVAATRDSIDRFMNWRPGLPVAVAGFVATLIAMTYAAWFSPQRLEAKFPDLHTLFTGYGLAPLAMQFTIWLGWALLAAGTVTAVVASYLRRRALAWVAATLGVVGVVLTLITLYGISKIGADNNVDSATGPWQNLGSGGWLACLGFSLLATAGVVAATANGRRHRAADPALSLTTDTSDASSSRRSTARTALLIGIAIALFFPPTMTEFWQKVLVSEIGVYVLLAIGLNVVVGWAGLLDLGYIAFYAIGSYTTAYLVGSLPHKPPSWLHMSPLLAIPFAIGICLLAGLALGAPTLRLRGDYLAIVTLGFGEIVRIIAVNNPANITNSTRGPSPAVPHPVISIGPFSITWGLNNLQYWYLLLVLITIVVIAFYRLEGSRLGRAWAAIREDEVAAQATGINTARVKLMAFAIGASTSGLAGVFFASQIGYFNPDNFILNNSILVVAYVVFGGMGSLPGAMAGAAILTWLPWFLQDQVPGPDRQMWVGALLVLMMIFRPAGLFPARRRKAELTGVGMERAPAVEREAVPAGEGL